MSSDAPRALILAAGKGVRLGELTARVLKPLLPVCGKPVIVWLIEDLRAGGVRELCINLHHLPEAIPAALGDGAALGVHLTYARETELLGTAGALRNFRDRLTAPCFVVYGDTLRSVDYAALLAQHRATGAAATIALHTVDDPASAGVVTLGADRRITGFVEKPQGMAGPALANAGVYCLGQAALDCAAALPAPCDFAYDVFPRLLAQGEPLYGFPLAGLVIDIGTTTRYAEAEARWTGATP